MYQSGAHMLPPPRRFLPPSPLHHEMPHLLFVERESDPDMYNTTVCIDSKSGTFVQVKLSSSASIFLSTPLHMWVGASALAIPETMAEDDFVFGVREARGRQPWSG
jgi:hypothetical protein